MHAAKDSANPPSASPEDSSHATKTILANAIDFLNEGLTLLFSSDPSSRTVKLAVVAIQMSIELLAKFRLTRELGLDGILSDTLPEGGLKAALKNRSLNAHSIDGGQ